MTKDLFDDLISDEESFPLKPHEEAVEQQLPEVYSGDNGVYSEDSDVLTEEHDEDLGDWSWSDDGDDDSDFTLPQEDVFALPEPAVEEAEPEKPPAEQPAKKRKGGLWSAIKADFTGGEPASDEDVTEGVPEDMTEEAPEDTPEKTGGRVRKGGLLKRVYAVVFTPYRFLCKVNLWVLKRILTVFGFIPFIGPVFKRVASSILVKVSKILPIVELAAFILIPYFSASLFDVSSVDFYDGGKVSVTNISQAEGGYTVEVSNDGDVTAEGTVELKLAKMFTGTKDLECESEIFTLEPEDTKKLDIPCDASVTPVLERLKGVFNAD